MQSLRTAESGPRGWRLGVVEQLLGDLDTATVAGLHFTMEKVVGLLRQVIGTVEPELNDLERRVIRRALEELGREQVRPLPDTHRFVARTEIITHTLALI